MIKLNMEIYEPPDWLVNHLRAWAIFTSLVLLVLVCLTDYLTGFELSFSIFYLIPVSISAIFAGGIIGALVALLSACAWYLADVLSGHEYTSTLIPIWNSVVRLGYFLMHTAMISALMQMYRKAEAISLKDPLTGLSNWRQFETLAGAALARARRSGGPLTIAYMDLDNFKAVNDTLGHDTGNELLQAVAGETMAHVREVDVVARLGGDEFALLLPDTGRDEADVVFGRLRASLAKAMTARDWPVTFSIGVITYTRPPASIAKMLKQADALMYRVKSEGKNGIIHEASP